jgi:hypothetical protein
MRGSIVAAAAGFSILAIVLFQPTPSLLAHTAPAFHGGAADALLLMWATSHVSEALFRTPLHLFDAGVFHPARLTLAYSDHMIGEALVGLPIWLATGNPLLEYNVLVLLSYVLCAAAAFAYARALGLGRTAAAAAGLVFAFTPYRFHSPLWLQVLFTPFVPLALLAWLGFVRTRALGLWLAWIGCWTLQGLMGMYLALYLSIVMGVFVVVAAVTAPPPRDRRLLVGLASAPLVVGCLLAPTLLPYAALRAMPGHVRTFGLDTPLDFFWPGPGTASAWLLGTERLGRFGPGVVVWTLAAVGIVTARRGRPRADLPAGFVWRVHLIGLATTLALAYVPIRWQYHVPGLDMIRATSRALYLSLFFVAVFVAEGVDRLVARPRSAWGTRAVVTVIAVALLADMGRPPRERLRMPVAADLPAPYRWLRALPDDPVVYDQVDAPEPLARAMYFQIFHRKRVPTGWAGFWNPATTYAIHRLYRFPAPESLRLLRALDVRYVLRHVSPALAAAERDDPDAGLAIVERDAGDLLYRVDPRPEPPEPPATALPRDGWTITASSGGSPTRALVDGNADTLWTITVPYGVTATPTLTIDLGAEYDVVGVRCRAPVERASGVAWSRVELSEDGTSFTPVPTGFEPDSLAALYEAPATVHSWEARFPPRRARWVRLTNGDLAFWGGEWVIGELEVLVPARTGSR